MAIEDGQRPVSVDNIRALVEDGGLGGDSVLQAPQTYELEDLTIRTGSFVNAGSGWNTFVFPEAFDDVPQVLASAEDGYGVEIKGVRADKFLYRCTTAGSSSVTVTPTKASYYVHTSKSTSTSSMHQVSLVTDVTASSSGGGSGSTDDACRVMWLAIEYGGD